MEEIIIKEIDKKDSGLVIVKYNGNREATMNTKWQSQEVDYIEKDVGIGGNVKVLIVQKGDYTNITKVDMTSGKKNESMQQSPASVPQNVGLMSQKEISIVSQCLTKCCFMEGKNEPQEVLETYNFFVKSFENNG